jgi:oxygen-independent coproporphyrinogen-3 oxidase
MWYNAAMRIEVSPKSLYVHVPFCRQKCSYCDFYSLAAHDDAALLNDWLTGVETEAAQSVDLSPRTVYLGGGTPTAVSLAALERLLGVLSRRYSFDQVEEFTVEANPGCLSEDQTRLLLASGVNRMSLGVQSMTPCTLATLGRIHGPDEVRRSVGLLRRMGLRNLSLDLMFAVPGQTTADCLQDVEAVLSLEPDHVSVYGLMLSPETPLGSAVSRGELQATEDEVYVEMLQAIRERLLRAGFEHYEISNYALPGRRCRHNLTYWHNEPYVGLGPAAASYVAGRRWTNVADVAAYAARLRNGQSPVAHSEELPPLGRARETAMLNLRTSDGLVIRRFHETTGYDPLTLFAEAIRVHQAAGLLEVTSGEAAAIRITPQALPVADSVLADFVA